MWPSKRANTVHDSSIVTTNPPAESALYVESTHKGMHGMTCICWLPVLVDFENAALNATYYHCSLLHILILKNYPILTTTFAHK